jgi:hypothetical protein
MTTQRTRRMTRSTRKKTNLSIARMARNNVELSTMTTTSHLTNRHQTMTIAQKAGGWNVLKEISRTHMQRWNDVARS